MSESTDRHVSPPGVRLILFTTGDAPRSRRARLHLKRAMEAHGAPQIPVDEIDLLKNPAQTAEYGIYASPALMSVWDHDSRSVIYGDLSEEDKLHEFLAGLRDAAAGGVGPR